MPGRTRSLNDWLTEQLTDNRAAASYINEIITDSPELFASALGDVARARRMANVAREANIPRESLYPMLSDAGNPTLQKLIAILDAVGLRIQVAPVQDQVQDRTPEAQGVSSVDQSPDLGEIQGAASQLAGVVLLVGQPSGGFDFNLGSGVAALSLISESVEETSLWNRTTKTQQSQRKIYAAQISNISGAPMTNFSMNMQTAYSSNQGPGTSRSLSDDLSRPKVPTPSFSIPQ